jgi:hypothetical protein
MRLGVGGSVNGSRRCGRRAFARSASIDRLVAMLYSHVRIDACSVYWSSPRQAASSVSWTRSSASWVEPTIR